MAICDMAYASQYHIDLSLIQSHISASFNLEKK